MQKLEKNNKTNQTLFIKNYNTSFFDLFFNNKFFIDIAKHLQKNIIFTKFNKSIFFTC